MSLMFLILLVSKFEAMVYSYCSYYSHVSSNALFLSSYSIIIFLIFLILVIQLILLDPDSVSYEV
jgi:hypothetical protein